MSALIEFDQVSGLVRGTEQGPVESTLLSAAEWTPESEAGIAYSLSLARERGVVGDNVRNSAPPEPDQLIRQGTRRVKEVQAVFFDQPR